MSNIGTNENIEKIYEDLKQAVHEETELSKEADAEFKKMNAAMEGLDYDKQQEIFECAVTFARSMEKSGFVTGFKMGANVIIECKE